MESGASRGWWKSPPPRDDTGHIIPAQAYCVIPAQICHVIPVKAGIQTIHHSREGGNDGVFFFGRWGGGTMNSCLLYTSPSPRDK